MGPSAKPLKFGRPRPPRLENHLQHTFEIACNIGIGEAKHDISEPAKHVIPVGVIGSIMRLAINLDHKSAIPADEIADEAIEHDLAAELQAVQLAITQVLPQLIFKQRRFRPHLAGKCGQSRIDPARNDPPPTPPLAGRGV